MCNGHQQQQGNSGQDTEENFQNWQGLYPDLSGLFNQQEHVQNQDRPSMFALLLNLLGIHANAQPYQNYNENTNMPEGPSPSAPPPSPGPRSNPNNGQNGSNGYDQAHCNRQRHQQPDFLTLLVARSLRFSALFTRCLVVFLAIIMFMTTVSLLPNSLLYSAAFLLLAGGLGLHLPTLVAGHVLYGLLSCFDPFLLIVISLWALHKTFIRRKPLIDMQFWKRKIAGMEHNC